MSKVQPQSQSELERHNQQPAIQRNTLSVINAGNTVNEAGADTTLAQNPLLEERVSIMIE